MARAGTRTPPRWQVVVAVLATCCSVFGSLALHYGRALIPPPPLGRHETVGTVSYVGTVDQQQWYAVGFSAPGQSGFGGLAMGPGPAPGQVTNGQSVVVRYDPAHPDVGTVVSVSAPRVASTVPTVWSPSPSSWPPRRGSGSRCATGAGRRQDEVDATDYRQDGFAGTSMSA